MTSNSPTGTRLPSGSTKIDLGSDETFSVEEMMGEHDD